MATVSKIFLKYFRFAFSCSKATTNSFCIILGCNPNALISPDLQMVKPCFQLNEAGDYVKNTISGCDAAKLVEKEGIFYQIGGPLESSEQLCKPTNQMFMFPYEAGFVLNFTVAEDNTPQGCGTLDGEWRKENQRPINEPDFIYPGKITKNS